MRYIDVFNHFFPEQLWRAMTELDNKGYDIGKRMRGIPAVHDIDVRRRIVENFDNYTQVLSLGMPPLESLGDHSQAEELARIANDGLAELVNKYPYHFVGFLAALPMSSPNAAREAERAFRDLRANGLQVHTNVNGRPLDDPEFSPVYEVAEKYNKPVFLHPVRGADMPDYRSEEKSKYEIWWTFGWPYETSTAMARLVFSGIMDRFPNLKVLAHHLGAMIPFFEGRVGPGWDQLGKRTSDEDLESILRGLKRRPLDYFKDFYADTAVFGSRSATVCGLEFYGPEKVLFASDSPFDPEKGAGYIRSTIEVLNSIELSLSDREKICFRNAQELLAID